MNAIRQVLIAEFYRRNYLFFLLCATLLVFVFRPPTLLFSPWFVLPMLEDYRFMGIVLALLLVYELKCWRELWNILHQKNHSFIRILAILPFHQLTWLMIRQLLGVMAPAILYVSVIAGYSVYSQTLEWIPLLLGQLGILLLVGIHLAHGIRSPREVTIRSGWQAHLERQFKESFSFISLQTLLHYHTLGILLTKSVVWTLMVFSLIAQQESPYPDKSMKLILLSLVGLQIMLAYWLRRSEDGLIFSLRNLPILPQKRFGAYVLTAVILFLPDCLIWLGANTQPLGTALPTLLFYLGLATGSFLAGIALLYYKALPVIKYLQIGFLAYLILFLAILFQIPAWIPILVLLGLSSLIFWEEYFQWNGFHQD
ncbi:MAG: hypothetical protein AAF587_28955 [Bacteroidota bacterium]